MAIVVIAGLALVGCTTPTPTKPTTPTTPTTPTPAQVIQLKMDSPNVAGSAFYERGMLPWARGIEWASNGRIKVTTYPGSTLFAEKDVVESMAAGLADVARIMNQVHPGRFPLQEVMALPGMARGLNSEQASQAWWELAKKTPELAGELTTTKLIGGMMLSYGTLVVPSTKPIRGTADIKGLKIRAWAGPTTEGVTKLGATTMVVPMPDVYLNLSKGVVDAYTGSWESWEGFKHYEIAPYVQSNLVLGHPVFTFIINKDTLNKLPADLQQVITDKGILGEEIGKYFGREVWDYFPVIKERTLAVMRKQNLKFEEVIWSDAELTKLEQEGLRPTWDPYIKGLEAKGKPAQRIFDESVKILNAYRAKYAAK